MAMLLPYGSLDSERSQIRLLKVEPTLASPPEDPLDTAFFDETPVRCSIEVVSLDDNPDFIALSYVWGDANQMAPIEIDGIEVSVTINLRRALVLHSSRQHKHRIWADAVCINQANLGEKSSQIGLMSRIYKQAVSVFCWLGLANVHIREYLTWRVWLDRGKSEKSQNRQALSDWGRWTTFLLRTWRPIGGSTEEHLYSVASVIKGQADFLGLPYFERMWTLQESTLPAPDRAVFAVGPYLVPGFDPRTFNGFFPPDSVTASLAALSRRLRHPGSRNQAAYAEVFDDALLLQGVDALHKARVHAAMMEQEESSGKTHDSSAGGHELGRLLAITGDRKCHDPRDKIFALLSLVGRQTDLTGHDEGRREIGLNVQGSRGRWLAVDYSKQVELVVRDALFYVNRGEDGVMFNQALKLYQPYKHALRQRQRSAALRRDHARNGTPAPSAKSRDFNVYRCRGAYRCPTWLPDMTRRNIFEAPGVLGPVSDMIPMRGIYWDAIDDVDDPSSREDRLVLTAIHVGKVVRVLPFPEQTVDILSVLTTLAYTFTLQDTTITAPINPPVSHNMAAVQYGVEPFSHPVEQRHGLPQNRAYHDLVSRITNKKHLYNRFCRAVLGDAYSAYPVTSRAFEENLFFWLTMQYSLKSLHERPEYDTPVRAQNLRMVEEIVQRVRGSALVLLDSGNFVVCADAVELGDVVVLAHGFRNTLLLRPDCLICRNEDGSCDGHRSSGELYRRCVSQQTHLLVGYPFVDGLRSSINYDEPWAKQVCGRDELYIVLG
ncbi:heterokaryon incompatibility protein-domain-containing protein [Microdochium bolleyi]|uniref:Heterokaryon incompatibility protein-domain-containing protein n=1 Tax=Microdochium bolleyi TaxID=196109 RepID=A0A136IYQ4_9PEZI|nr:heterokaryon incompatibility protein-domain-containing protein [Microdochium bolleyi]